MHKLLIKEEKPDFVHEGSFEETEHLRGCGLAEGLDIEVLNQIWKLNSR